MRTKVSRDHIANVVHRAFDKVNIYKQVIANTLKSTYLDGVWAYQAMVLKGHSITSLSRFCPFSSLHESVKTGPSGQIKACGGQ